jgi:hypothetical protein
MKQTVYIETTIPSYYYNRRNAPELVALSKWTRDWWDHQRQNYNLVTSVPVLEELMRGNHPLKKEKLALIDALPLLPVTDEVTSVAEFYITRKAMPADPKGDALHLALASVYKCDILLSWNCRHIANHQKAGYVRKLNIDLGLAVPALLTPFALLNEEFPL